MDFIAEFVVYEVPHRWDVGLKECRDLLYIILFFSLIYAESMAISNVYSFIASHSSGFMAFTCIGLSFVMMASLGARLIRYQSRSFLRNMNAYSPDSTLPKPNPLVFLAGFLFLVPGYVSDVAALVLLFPPSAWLIKRIFGYKLKKFTESGNIKFYGSFGGRQKPSYQNTQDMGQLSSDPTIIDVEVLRP